MTEKICIECKKNVVWYYGSHFCKDCLKKFLGKREENEGIRNL